MRRLSLRLSLLSLALLIGCDAGGGSGPGVAPAPTADVKADPATKSSANVPAKKKLSDGLQSTPPGISKE